jgi:hypothetical protein
MIFFHFLEFSIIGFQLKQTAVFAQKVNFVVNEI